VFSSDSSSGSSSGSSLTTPVAVVDQNAFCGDNIACAMGQAFQVNILLKKLSFDKLSNDKHIYLFTNIDRICQPTMEVHALVGVQTTGYLVVSFVFPCPHRWDNVDSVSLHQSHDLVACIAFCVYCKHLTEK
jgi:hypothetical protein